MGESPSVEETKRGRKLSESERDEACSVCPSHFLMLSLSDADRVRCQQAG